MLARQRLKVLSTISEPLQVLAGKELSIEEMATLVFRDPRDNGTMLLTNLGFEIMKKSFDCWSQELTGKMTMSNHTYLFDVSKFPYHVSNRKSEDSDNTIVVLYTFDSNLGVLMKMVSGSFERLESLNPRK